MTHKFLIELPDGTFIRKNREEIQPDDLVVFDWPDSFTSTDALRKQLDDEIEAAGGIDEWRKRKLPEIEGAK